MSGLLRSSMVAALLFCTTPALTLESDLRLGAPRYGTPWMHLRVGMTFADNLAINDTDLGLTSNGDPAMVFGIGAHWRTSRFDFGLLFEAMSSYGFTGAENNRVGAQFRAAADLRWRYIEDFWGSLFLRLTPGLTALAHADPLRFQVATLTETDIEGVDQHNVGFSLGFAFGVLIYLEDSLALSIDLDVISMMTSLDTDGGEVDLDMVRGLFALSLEWRL